MGSLSVSVVSGWGVGSVAGPAVVRSDPAHERLWVLFWDGHFAELETGGWHQDVALQGRGLSGLRPLAAEREGEHEALVSQTIDLNGDGETDELIFQSDFGPKASKSFLIDQAGSGEVPASKVLAKFVPSRYDDFARENDRVAESASTSCHR